MLFEAYLDNIQKEVGKNIGHFKQLAEKKGFLQKGKLKQGVKTGDIVAWLTEHFQLGHGHSMAIFAVLRGKKD